MAKEKQKVEPYWSEKLLEGYALATDATTAERRITMDEHIEKENAEGGNACWTGAILYVEN